MFNEGSECFPASALLPSALWRSELGFSPCGGPRAGADPAAQPQLQLRPAGRRGARGTCCWVALQGAPLHPFPGDSATAHRAGSECAATEASALCFGERAGRVTRRRLATRPRSVPGGRSLVPGVSRQRAWELVSSKRCRQGDPGAGGSALTTCGGHSVLQGDWLLPEKALRLLRGEGSGGEAICMLFA